MDLINLKDVSNLNVNFNVKVIDIDFYNVSKRKIFLGHVGDYNLYVLHLIIPKDSDWADPMQIILSYQNNTLSKAKWVANPNKIVGNSYYFLINGDIVSTAGEGFLQFQVVLPNNDATTKTVIAKSKKIPYIVEESLTLEGSAEEVTPEQISSIDSLITDYTNMLESYDLNDIFELERRVEVLEGLHGSENIYNPFEEYDIVELQLSNNIYNVTEPTHDLTTIKSSRVIETSASVYNGRQFLRLNDFETRAGDKLTLTGKVIVNKAKENFTADRIMICCIVNQSTNIPSSDVVDDIELKESLYDSTYIGTLGKEGWFSYTTTLEEDGNYLIFGACARSRQLVGDGTSSNPYAPIKISNLKLIKCIGEEEINNEETIFSHYSKNDIEKAYVDVEPISVYRTNGSNEEMVTKFLNMARVTPEYYLTDNLSYSTSLIDTFFDINDTTNYAHPLVHSINVPINSTTIEIVNTQTKDKWVYDVTGQQYFDIKNLIPEQLYIYSFKNGNNIINSHFIKVKGPVRFIDIGLHGAGEGQEEEIVNNKNRQPEATLFNVRDLGGWNCDRGKLKYGLIYRGSTLSEKYEGTDIILNENQKQYLVNELKIRDEISLRYDSEISGRTSSILDGINNCSVGYKNFNIGYSNPLTGNRPQLIAQIIKRIAYNVYNNRATYMHCSAGADRTAIICSIIEAICGVSQLDIDCDYELSSFSMDRKKFDNGARYGERLKRDRDPYGSESSWDRGYLFNVFRQKGNGNLRDGVINFLIENGVTRKEIDMLRAGMIEYNNNNNNNYDNSNINVDTDDLLLKSTFLTEMEDDEQLIKFRANNISLSPASSTITTTNGSNVINIVQSGSSSGTVPAKTIQFNNSIFLIPQEVYVLEFSWENSRQAIFTLDLGNGGLRNYILEDNYNSNITKSLCNRIKVDEFTILNGITYKSNHPLPTGRYTITLHKLNNVIKQEYLGINRFIEVENGTIPNNNILWYAQANNIQDYDTYKMQGTYRLINGLCFLTASAKLYSSSNSDFFPNRYSLPVPAIETATTVAVGTNKYIVSTAANITSGSTDYSVLQIYPFSGNIVNETIYFTLCYKYK